MRLIEEFERLLFKSENGSQAKSSHQFPQSTQSKLDKRREKNPLRRITKIAY